MVRRIVIAVAFVAALGVIVGSSPVRAQSDQVGTLMDFDFPGESRKNKGLKSKQPKATTERELMDSMGTARRGKRSSKGLKRLDTK